MVLKVNYSHCTAVMQDSVFLKTNNIIYKLPVAQLDRASES